jgi:hypothetical protein
MLTFVVAVRALQFSDSKATILASFEHISRDAQTTEEKVFAALKRRTIETEEFRAPPKEAARPEPRPPRAPRTPVSFDKAFNEVIARFRKTLHYLAAK